MVLEVFTALSLAAGIVQFVDYGTRLFSKSKEIYQSATGASSEGVDLQLISKTVRDLSAGLASSSYEALGPSSNDEKHLVDLAHECNKAAAEILSVLNKIQDRNGSRHTRLTSFRQALLLMWNKEKTEELAKKMYHFRDQVGFCLSKIMLDRQSSVLSMLNDLSDANARLELNTTISLERLRSDVLGVLDQFKVEKAKESASQKGSPAVCKKDKRGSNNDKINIKVDKVTVKYAPLLAAKLSTLVEDGSKVATEQHVLKSLFFQSIRARHSQIVEAHLKTFDWLFTSQSSSGDQQPRFEFIDWLRSENGTYWVSGKPGSGKSTLLKYLSDSPQTREVLIRWAQGKELFTASFFFWNAGSDLQKSQEGLLRSILYEILRQCPVLIPEVVPLRWSTHSTAHSEVLDSWSTTELKSACVRLKNQKIIPARFCFFVDGLDEYDGDHIDLISGLNDLSGCPDIKICLSSRPWNVFQEAFGGNCARTLKLEDLTQNDIKIYVQDTLQENSLFRVLRESDPRYQELIEEIVGKAKGVFLWVFLVVRSLLKGITNSDRISELQSRLRLLPADLETYFQHILDSTDEVYQCSAAQTFRIALEATEPLLLYTYSFLDEEVPEHAINLPVKELTRRDIASRFELMRKRLNARCNGLLEVIGSRDMKSLNLDKEHNLNLWDVSIVSWKSTEEIFRAYRVDFLHRTVRDFLLTKDLQRLLIERAGEDFRPNLRLCLAFLGQMKSLSLSSLATSTLSDLCEDLIFYTRREEQSSNLPQTLILDEFNCSIISCLRFSQYHRKMFPPGSASFLQSLLEDPFLGVMLQNGLWHYARKKLDEYSAQRPVDCDVMSFALKPSFAQKHRGESLSVEGVQYLLNLEQVRVAWIRGSRFERGVELGNAPSVWNDFMNMMSMMNMESRSVRSDEEQKTYLKITRVLLGYSNTHERSHTGSLWTQIMCDIALHTLDVGARQSQFPTPAWMINDMVVFILNSGAVLATPNEPCCLDQTAWTSFLTIAIYNEELKAQLSHNELVRRFVERGADLKDGFVSTRTGTLTIMEVLRLILPPEEFRGLLSPSTVSKNRLSSWRSQLKRRSWRKSSGHL